MLGKTAPGHRRPDCPHACRDLDHSCYQTFCDSGEPECIACGQFLGVIPEVWDAWTEDGHGLDVDRWPYGPGDIRFKGRLLLMFGYEATAENTRPGPLSRRWLILRRGCQRRETSATGSAGCVRAGGRPFYRRTPPPGTLGGIPEACSHRGCGLHGHQDLPGHDHEAGHG